MIWKPLPESIVTVLDHVVAVPCEHEGLEHQADGMCYLGLVPTPAVAGGCELRIPSCGGHSLWEPH